MNGRSSSPRAEATVEHVHGSDIVVLCAANMWHGLRYADQQLALHLAAHRPVLYVDPPMSWLTAGRDPSVRSVLREPRLRAVAPGITRLTPVVLPGPERPGMCHVTSALVRRGIRRAVNKLRAPVHAVIATSPFLDVFGSCDEHVRIFWAQDDLAGGADLLGLDPKRIRAGERRRAASADVIVASTPGVMATWETEGYEPEFIPYGSDVAHYECVGDAAPASDVGLEPPITGFVGVIGARIDFEMLEAVASSGHSLLLIGPTHRSLSNELLRRLLTHENVRWLGAKTYDELPSYLRVIDVGIVPYTDSPFNRGSFPLKTLEYLSAGKAVVATDLPAIRWLDSDLVAVSSQPSEFAAAVDTALREPSTPELIAQRRAFARNHSWDRRAIEFDRVITSRRTERANGERFAR